MDVWRLKVPIDAPPMDISRHYNQICKTHKMLVNRGEIMCSVSLSESPEVSSQEAPSLIDQSV